MPGRGLKIHHTPGGLHDQGHRQPSGHAPAGERPQVSRQLRRQVGVGDGGGEPLVLPELRENLVRSHHGDPRQAAPQRIGDLALVLGMEKGEQQAHGHGLKTVNSREGGGDLPRSLGVQRHDHTGGTGTLHDGVTELARHQRRRVMAGEIVEGRSVLPADLDDVGESPRGHQSGPRTPPLQQRVGGDRGAVSEPLDRPRLGGQTCPADGTEHPHGWVGGHRRHLRGNQPAAVIDSDQVGEGPTHIDPEPHRHTGNTRTVTNVSSRPSQRLLAELARGVCATAPREACAPTRSLRIPAARTVPATYLAHLPCPWPVSLVTAFGQIK